MNVARDRINPPLNPYWETLALEPGKVDWRDLAPGKRA